MIACPSCDRLHREPRLGPRQRARCGRCGQVLRRGVEDVLQRVLALSLAAAVLLAVVNLTPFMRVSLEGQVQTNTIASGVILLWRGGTEALAVLILFTTLLAPAFRVGALLYALLPLAAGRRAPGLRHAIRFQGSLVPWAMLDVYMLAVLVAYAKLSMMADIELQEGAYAFLALFGVLTLVAAAWDGEAVWRRLEAIS